MTISSTSADFRFRSIQRQATFVLSSLILVGFGNNCLANGLQENVPWQFPTVGDKWSRSLVLDQLEKMKGGFYDAPRNTYTTYSTTNIDRQYNCMLTASSTGNTGTNATTASTSSPTVTNSGSTNANTAANAATNDVAQSGLNGVLVSGLWSPPNGTVSNGQSNTGSLTSGVHSSNTSATTGPVSANGGTTSQVLNSYQTSSGSQTSSISGSTACAGPLN